MPRSQAVADRLQPVHVVDGSEAVVQRLKADPRLGGLALGPLVAVNADFGGEREIGAELDKERTEVGVHAVEVEEVNERCRPHQPGVAAAGGWIVPPLSTPHARFLLGSTDIQHPLGGGETGQELLGELVLALSLGESDQLQATRGDEVVNVGHERLAHGIHQRGRGITVAAMADEEPRDSTAVGQSGHPDVEIHPIDALDLEGHVVGEHIGDGAR